MPRNTPSKFQRLTIFIVHSSDFKIYKIYEVEENYTQRVIFYFLSSNIPSASI